MVTVRYDGPGDVYVLPDLGIALRCGELRDVGEDVVARLMSAPHDRFTVVRTSSPLEETEGEDRPGRPAPPPVPKKKRTPTRTRPRPRAKSGTSDLGIV